MDGRRSVATEGLVRRGERWTTSISWPAVIDERLRALVDVAIEAGETDSLARNELLAALVADAPADGVALRQLLSSYRQMQVRELILPPMAQGAGVVYLSDRQPGRRRAGS